MQQPAEWSPLSCQVSSGSAWPQSPWYRTNHGQKYICGWLLVNQHPPSLGEEQLSSGFVLLLVYLSVIMPASCLSLRKSSCVANWEPLLQTEPNQLSICFGSWLGGGRFLKDAVECGQIEHLTDLLS